MSTLTSRLVRIFTPEYARRINAHLVYPVASVVVKPNELESALMRPLQVSIYEPHQLTSYLAATLCYGIIKGRPFMDGNKRTAFFLAHEYIRMTQTFCSVPEGKTRDEGATSDSEVVIATLAQPYIAVAAGKMDVAGLAAELRLT
ncbi:hypothetical protein C8R42DRAFT_580577 [Lentinula raphanica]|nr:hypothetical protein C8R42DRAFT_580577 [Lentinula raphanica]